MLYIIYIMIFKKNKKFFKKLLTNVFEYSIIVFRKEERKGGKNAFYNTKDFNFYIRNFYVRRKVR